jgi:phage-related minor tail protein
MEDQMKRTIDKVRDGFDERMHGLKISIGGDLQRMKEEVTSMQRKINSNKEER